MSRPLEGLTVLEFSQFLSGPYAGLRLSDLGARVIKIIFQKRNFLHYWSFFRRSNNS